MSHNDQALTLVQRGEAIAVSTVQDYLDASDFLKGATALTRSIQEHYKPLKQAADQLHDQIVAAEKSQLSPIQSVIERVKGLLIGYQNVQKQIAAREQAELQAKADKKGGAVVPQMQVKAAIPTVAGVSGRSTWRCEIVDRDLIPYEYLQPDQKALDAAAKRMKAAFNVPGARAVEDQNVVVKGV